MSKNDVHWIYNEDAAAQFFGIPYSPLRRNPGTRGQNVSTINFSMFKTTQISERVAFRLEAQVYNLFNHQFRGVPDPFIDDCSLLTGGLMFAALEDLSVTPSSIPAVVILPTLRSTDLDAVA